jgi:glycosyltransferase involved in cell wall biosynthesis
MQGINTHLYANGYSIEPKKLFSGNYAPSILKSRIEIESSSKIVRKILCLPLVRLIAAYLDLRPHAEMLVIANGQIEAKTLWILNLFLSNKIKYVCFIHGSFFQFRDDLYKYAWIFRSRFNSIWNGDPVYKELIPQKRPSNVSLRTILEIEILSIFEYLGVKNARSVFVLTNKNKIEIERLYKHNNVIVAHGAFSREVLHYVKRQDIKARLGFEDKKIILSLSRLARKKRIDLLIRGFSVYCQNNAKFNGVLLIGGTGSERDNLEKLALGLGVINKVHFAEFIPETELLDYYACCDIFASADNADYDITTLTALAMGKKVVVSSQHEFDNSLDELNLIHKAESDPESYARCYKDALDTPTNCNAQRRIQLLDSYSWETYFGFVRDNLLETVV